MKRFILALAALSLPLSACTTMRVPTSPAAVADQSKLDEQTGLALTLAYTGASRAAGLAITTAAAIGKPLASATVKRIGELDARAFAAVTAVRQAYLAANSASYEAAIREAHAAVAALLSAIGANPTALLHVPARTLADGYAAAREAHAGLTTTIGGRIG